MNSEHFLKAISQKRMSKCEQDKMFDHKNVHCTTIQHQRTRRRNIQSFHKSTILSTENKSYIHFKQPLNNVQDKSIKDNKYISKFRTEIMNLNGD